jgi:hypothetical protein
MHIKQKLKGRVSERDDEISKLKQEIEALKTKPTVNPGTRPSRDDFDDDQDYQAELDRFEDKRAEERYERIERSRSERNQRRTIVETQQQAVDSHYDRAAKLIDESGISSERYKTADLKVRAAFESIMPKMGDAITDQMISVLDSGSEKAMYYLGNNSPALDKASKLLAEDRSGLKLAAYLGDLKREISKPKKMTSNAPDPAPIVDGDSPVNNVNGSNLKKQYLSAMKLDDVATAFPLKRQAKRAGIDVSEW